MSRELRTNGRQAERSEAAVSRALDAALELFSTHGYGGTSMRQLADASGLSVGNLYHHFGSKEAIFQRLIDDYLRRLVDPASPLLGIYTRAAFPDDLEEMADAIGRTVEQNAPYIMLIYVDVIEFKGEHIRTFYQTMADRFAAAYGPSFERMHAEGRIGDVNPLVAVMLATRWFFYFFTVEKCFGVPMHFGMSERQAVDECIRILRYGVLPRPATTADEAARRNQQEGRTS